MYQPYTGQPYHDVQELRIQRRRVRHALHHAQRRAVHQSHDHRVPIYGDGFWYTEARVAQCAHEAVLLERSQP